jgi:hypothetical protein
MHGSGPVQYLQSKISEEIFYTSTGKNFHANKIVVKYLLACLLEVLSSKVTSGPLRELPVRFILVLIVSWHVLNLLG